MVLFELHLCVAALKTNDPIEYLKEHCYVTQFNRLRRLLNKFLKNKAIKSINNKDISEIFENIYKDKNIPDEETLLVVMFDRYEQSTQISLNKLISDLSDFNYGDIEKMLIAATIKFPNLIWYSPTFGLNSINLK